MRLSHTTTAAWLVGVASSLSTRNGGYGGYSGTGNSTLPIVDLGYVRQQATTYNQTGDFYTFSNIRYAAPPVGNLRFRAPRPPTVDRTAVDNGTVNRVCYQVLPGWLGITLPTDPSATEDCLFLDVAVPKAVFQEGGWHGSAPVLVWIYGGGYDAGSKTSTPAGLIARSQANGDKGVIYVALNYRLGAFGWLSGPTFEADGTPNAGLYDQRLALEWVQQNIAKFGGDPRRVTVIGESAGAGSILHQITAYGGDKGPAPFQQAILQSPGFAPTPSNIQKEESYQEFLTNLGVSTIEEARKLSSEALQEGNVATGKNVPYGLFSFGPVVDGNFAPDLPGPLLQQGRFDKDLKIIVGHNSNEGLLFTPPTSDDQTVFDDHLHAFFPLTAKDPALQDYIENTLYPPIFDGSHGYVDNVGRAAKWQGEAIFVCNTFYVDKAFGNKTYSYEFAVPPGIHGEDVSYTFYTGPKDGNPVAYTLQRWITDFALTGTPNGPDVAYFVQYGNNATLNVLNTTGVTQTTDDAANDRCNWWQKALYY